MRSERGPDTDTPRADIVLAGIVYVLGLLLLVIVADVLLAAAAEYPRELAIGMTLTLALVIAITGLGWLHVYHIAPRWQDWRSDG